ncbi:MAG TPA: FTR1 family protein [Roseiflexaceae bacterium]|nr:FTR1 family protein [Roseiflexaceae bacterium]
MHAIRWTSFICAIVTGMLVPLGAFAAATTPPQSAETMRKDLAQAQIAFTTDPAEAQQRFAEAATVYADQLAAPLQQAAPSAATQVQAAFAAASKALAERNAPAFAGARATIWTALLHGSFIAVETALERGDGATAQAWLPLREYRHATRFSRPGADATLAVDGAASGTMTPADALAAVRADMLDTYQARLSEALTTAHSADGQGFASRRAEAAALAQGYFQILEPAYRAQRGADAAQQAERAFADLANAALHGSISHALPAVENVLKGFRAAPLNADEQVRRAGQLMRFLSLVPVEYSRGVHNGQVTTDLEIREAMTFRDGAAAAFTDLQTLMEARDAARTAQVARLFKGLDQQLAAASAHADEVAAPEAIQASVEQITTLLGEIMPAEWQKHDNNADFDVIASALDQMETAVAARQYDLAESARLEAYAILESGPEAKLIVFAPQFKPVLEGLFWYGDASQRGLAYLLEHSAPASEIRTTRQALDRELAAAQQALAGNNAPTAVATNAAVIVFREGLEAVLILASLMGSLKVGEQRRFRKPLWWGAALAFIVTILTWLLAREILVSLARYGEKLEAIVSLIAIGVLLLITNWFFHSMYWTGWMANFHQHKKRLISGVAGQFLGLVTLGFTSIYREGFETVLFLQALVLEANTATVLGGVAVGLGATLLIGLLVFAVQTKLPHKKMLIVTGIFIGVVLLQMVGKTINIMQVIGWMPIHPIRWLSLPYWMGMWFGLYATWEGIILQVAAGIFVIGSYFLAERRKHRPAAKAPATVQPRKVQTS